MKVIAQQGDTVDLLCYRYLGTTQGGVVEATYERNRGLADLGPVLPLGTEVDLADMPATPAGTIETVQLWD